MIMKVGERNEVNVTILEQHRFAKIAEALIALVQELKPVRKTGSSITDPDNLLFVHGLENSKTRGLRKSLETWLRGIDLPNTRLTCIGFDMAGLLAKGIGMLISLSDALLKHIRQLQRSERYMFIAHGIAGWVVKDCLSRFNSADIASRAGIIFLGSLHNNSEDWAAFTESFLKQNSKDSRHEGRSIEQPERTHRKSLKILPKRRTESPASTSSQTFRFLQDVVDSNFLLMCKQYMPVLEYIELQPQSRQPSSDDHILPIAPQTGIGLAPLKPRRTDLSHSSSFSTEQLIELSLFDVQPNTQADRRVRSLLETRISRNKSFSTDMADADFGRLPECRSTPFSTEKHYVRETATPKSPVMTHVSPVEASKHIPAASTLALKRNAKPFENGNDLRATQTKGLYENPEKEKQEPVRQSKDLIKTKLILASVYHNCGKLEAARNVYEEMLRPFLTSVNFEDHELRFTIRCRVAEIQLQEGRFEEAETLFTQLELDTQTEGGKKTRVALEISRWLGITFDKRGHFRKAYQKLEAVEKGIEEATQKCEPKQSSDLKKSSMLTKNALALVLAHMGDFAKAIAASDDAIKIAQRNGGAEADSSIHNTTIDMNRAAIFADSGDYERASIINEVSRKLEKQFGPKNLATLECWSLQTQLLIAKSRHEEAQDRAQETLHGMRKELGKEHPSTLKLLGSLVLIYLSQGRIADAMETAQYVFQANQSSSALGPYHPQTISSSNALAIVKAAAGQLQEAEVLQRKVVKQAEDCLGEHHPDSLNYKSTLASIHCQMGEWAKSQELTRPIFWMQWNSFLGTPWKQVNDPVIPNNDELWNILERLRISGDSLVKPHPSLLTTMHCLGVAERERENGHLFLAIELLSVAVTLRRKRFGASHSDTLWSQFELAKAERECGSIEKLRIASNIFEEVLTQRRKLLGESHPDTLSARHELGVTKFQMGYEIEAAQEQAKVLKLKIKVLGTRHPDTIKSQLDMAKVYQSLGDIQKAETLQLVALTMQIRQSELTELGLSVADEDDKRRLYALILDRFVGKQYTESNFAPPRSHEEPRYHPDIVTAAADLASIYAELNDAAKRQSAADIQEIVVGLQERYLGNNDVTTLVSVNGLGLIYQALGRTQDAITQYARARKNSKENSPLHLASQSNLASLYFAEGDFKNAEDIQEAVLNGQRSSASNDPKALIESMFNLALTRKERAQKAGGGYGRALELMQEAVELSETLGHIHPLYIEMDNTLREWEDMAEAEEEGEGLKEDPRQANQVDI